MLEERIRTLQPQAQFEYLDLAGNGDEKHRRSFTHISEYCVDLRRRSRFLQAGKRVNLITISLASMIAVFWAQHYPAEVQKIVLMNTSDKNFSKFYERLQPHNLKFLLNLFQKNKDGGKYSMFPDTTRENFFRQIVAASRFGFPKQKPHADFLMLSSLGDELVNPKCSDRIAQAWKIAHSIHPQAAHDLPIAEPLWCAEEILRWLKKHDSIKKKESLHVANSKTPSPAT